MNRDDVRERCACRTWPADPAALGAIRRQVGDWLDRLRLAGDARDDLVYATNEAVTNAIEHAYEVPGADQVVELSMWTEDGRLFVQIVDHGCWRVPIPRRTGRGRGLQMMRRLTDDVQINIDERGTRVLLSHPLSGADGQA